MTATIAAPQIENLAVAKLIVDPEVQRSVDTIRVQKIVADYDPAALGTVVISRRDDGTCHIIDGQHRVQATIAAGYGDGSLTCLTYEGLSRQDEAAMFRRLNNTRQVTHVDKFRVRVIEGDPTAVTLNSILNRHGWTVQAAKTSGSFAAVSALEAIFNGKLNGPGTTAGTCDTLIRVITEAWGHDAAGVRSEIVAGIGAVLLHYNTRVEQAKLISELGQTKGGPLGLIGRAKGLRDYRGGRLADAFAEVVVELLNRQKRTHRLPDWRSAA